MPRSPQRPQGHVDRRPDAFPKSAWTPERVMRRLREARSEDWDFRDGRIFGSMCTQPDPTAVEAADLFPTANLGNPGLCPGTSRLEEEVIAILRDLYHAPPYEVGGSLVTGGTEANVTALWIARNVSGAKEVVLPRSAHFSLAKALDLLSLKPRWVPVGPDGRSDVRDILRAITSRTAAIVGIAGTTELGAVDPLGEISEAALDAGVHFHVDAAFGGFVLPFFEAAGRKPIPFDFALEGVTSLGTDPHKMGTAPVPSGVLLLRRTEEDESISTASPYLSSPRLSALLGTRPSRTVAGTYAALMGHGRAGYARLVRRMLKLTDRLREGAAALGLEPAVEPTMNILALRHPTPLRVQSAMLQLGWDISSVKEPSALRLVVMPHVTEASVDLMLRDLGRVLRSVR